VLHRVGLFAAQHSDKAEARRHNGDCMTINRLNARFSNRAFRPQPAIAQGITSAITPALIEDQLSPRTQAPLPAESPAIETNTDIVYLSDLQLQPVEWLWQHRLAAGTLAMLSGEPGSGKTWVALAIAAALTRGRAPCTGEKLQPCTVLYASTEHAAAQVVHPRFAKLEGDPARLVVLRAAASANSMSSSAGRLRDLALLEDALQRTQARLVILDPWDDLFSPEVDLHRPAETRPLLDQLAHLAERHRCCILLIRHLSKRIAGRPIRPGHASNGLSAALRTEFLAGSSPDAPAQPALLHVKSNLGPLAPPLDYRIGEAGSFLWMGLSNLTPDELLSDRPTGAGLPKRKFAAQWLRLYLQDGSRTQGVIETAAERDGVCVRTLRRAKFDLGVRSSKDGKSGVWCWTLPPPAEHHPAFNQAR
jgi:hypothetical protein